VSGDQDLYDFADAVTERFSLQGWDEVCLDDEETQLSLPEPEPPRRVTRRLRAPAAATAWSPRVATSSMAPAGLQAPPRWRAAARLLKWLGALLAGDRSAAVRS